MNVETINGADGGTKHVLGGHIPSLSVLTNQARKLERTALDQYPNTQPTLGALAVPHRPGSHCKTQAW